MGLTSKARGIGREGKGRGRGRQGRGRREGRVREGRKGGKGDLRVYLQIFLRITYDCLPTILETNPKRR